MSFVTTESQGSDNKNRDCAKYATETDGAIIRYHLRRAGGGTGRGVGAVYIAVLHIVQA